MKDYIQKNQKLWDDWAALHPHTPFYDMGSFLGGKSSLNPIELEAVGKVKDKSLLHLQCHFGQDSLSWARMGAKVTGVDFSGKAITTARALNAQLGTDATFIQSDVLGLKGGKLGQQFDIVFTSYGVITWLPSLDAWAEAIATHLRPGGFFYMVEFHPMLMMFEFETGACAYPYFHEEEPIIENVEGSYAAPLDTTTQNEEHCWQYSLSEVINPLLNRGLKLESFQEYDYSPYNCWPNMREVAPGKYQLEKPAGLPHLFALKMARGH